MSFDEGMTADALNSKALFAFCKDLTKVLEVNIKQQKELIASLRKTLEKEEKKCAALEEKLAACREKLTQPPKPKKEKVELPFNAIKKLKEEGEIALLTALKDVADIVLDAFLKQLDAHHEYQARGINAEDKRKAICALAKKMLGHGGVFS